VIPADDLPDRRCPRAQVAAAGALALVVYLSFLPVLFRTSSPPTGDQAYYLLDAISLAQDGDLDVSNNYAQRDEDKFYRLAPHPSGFVGESAPYPLPPHLMHTPARPETEQYSFHSPGLGLLLVPSWVVGSWFHLWWPATVVFMCALAALVAVNAFLLAYEQSGDSRVAWGVLVPMAFSAPLACFAPLAFTEIPTALLIVYAFRRYARGFRANGLGRLALAGLCVAYIPWLSLRCGAIAALLALYAVAQWWRARGRLAELLTLAVPCAVSAAAMAAYFRFLTGSIVPSQVIRVGGEQVRFHWPWRGVAELKVFAAGALGIFFDQQWGLLVYAPFYVAAAVGAIALAASPHRGERRLLAGGILVCTPYLFVIAAYHFWGGLWGPPGRYLVPIVPLLALPLAASLTALASRRAYRLLYAALAAPGFVYTVLVTHDFRWMWPAERGYFWGVLTGAIGWPKGLDFRSLLPAFAWPHELRFWWQSAAALGAAALVVLAGHWLLPRRGGRWAVAGWAFALLLLGSGWYLTAGERIGSRTVLVARRRFPLAPAPKEPYGIAYLDGIVYIADYRGAAVGALDTRSGDYRLVRPHSGGLPLAFAQPGDVKAGADGVLYVLNNGGGRDALWLMRPDGEVLRRIALAEKTPIAVGLAVASPRALVVSDMYGGVIREFSREGVHLRSVPEARLNNPAGVAVAEDGTVYFAESSNGMVHALDAKGGTKRWDLGCTPYYLAIDGDFVDVTCPDRLVSIRRKSGVLRRSPRLDEAPLAGARGLAYGAPGILYVADQVSVTEFEVRRL